jgi:type IV secretory pathway VirB10-like protein
MTERHLDDAIDRAVRDIMSAEPRPGLRERVLRQIDVPPRWRITLPAVVGAAACAAVLIALVLPDRPPRQTPPSSTSVARTPPAAATPGNPPPASGTRESAAVAPSVTTSGPERRLASRRPPRTIRAAVSEPDDMGLPPLSEAPPLSMGAIEPRRLTTRELTIDALSVTPITVEPLPQSGADTIGREDR